MKDNRRTFKKFLSLLLFFTVLAGPTVYPAPAEACWVCKTWKDTVWTPLKNEARRFGEKITRELKNIGDRVGKTVKLLYNSAKSIVRAVEDFVKDPSLEALQNILFTAVNTITYIGCDVEKLDDDLYAICFSKGQADRLKAAYAVMKVDFPLLVNGIDVEPYRHVLSKVQMIYRGDSVRNLTKAIVKLQGQGDVDAYFSGDKQGIVFLMDSAFSARKTPYSLAGLLLHEADHGRYGAHTNGKSADKDTFGPYGSDLKYLLQIYRHGTETFPSLSPSDCDTLRQRISNALMGRKVGGGLDKSYLFDVFEDDLKNNCAQ